MVNNPIKELDEEIKEGKHIESNSDKIEKLASDLGIDTEDKSEEELLEEINKAIPKKKES